MVTSLKLVSPDVVVPLSRSPADFVWVNRSSRW
jgi:hypothetical protein